MRVPRYVHGTRKLFAIRAGTFFRPKARLIGEVLYYRRNEHHVSFRELLS